MRLLTAGAADAITFAQHRGRDAAGAQGDEARFWARVRGWSIAAGFRRCKTLHVSTTTVHLVRHGEPEAHGDNPGLTDVGRHQAERAGARLADAGAVRVLHSSRRRARETGILVADALSITPEHSPHAEDLTPVPTDWSLVPVRYHEFLRNVPDVERDLDGARLDVAFNSLTAIGRSDRTLVVVTHNFVIGWFVRRTLEAPWWRWIGLNQDNGAITTITRSDHSETRLRRFNDSDIS